MQETNLRDDVVLSPGSGRLQGQEMATHSSVLAWEIPWTEERVGYSPWGRKESDIMDSLSTSPHPMLLAWWTQADGPDCTERLAKGGLNMTWMIHNVDLTVRGPEQVPGMGLGRVINEQVICAGMILIRWGKASWRSLGLNRVLVETKSQWDTPLPLFPSFSRFRTSMQIRAVSSSADSRLSGTTPTPT